MLDRTAPGATRGAKKLVRTPKKPERRARSGWKSVTIGDVVEWLVWAIPPLAKALVFAITTALGVRKLL